MRKLLLIGVSALAGLGAGVTIMSKQMNRVVHEKHVAGENYRVLYEMLDRWIICRQQGKNLEEYFLKRDYKRIGVYGLGRMGTLFVNDMKESSIVIIYGIDKNAEAKFDFDLYSPNQKLPEVDAIVITPMVFAEEIEKLLRDKVSCPIVTLEEVVYEMVEI